MNKKLFGIVGAVLLVCAVAFAQNTLVYLEQGGAKQVVLSGGEIEVRSGGTLDIQTGSSVDLPTGSVVRADLTEDALAVYDIGTQLWVTQAYMTYPMVPVAAYGGSTGIYYKGDDAQNVTITTQNSIDFRLPPEYVAGGDIKFSCYTKYAGTGTVGATKTIDVVAKKVTVATGALGADICATAPITLTNAYALAEFTITATGLVAGDVIQINLATALQETGNMNPIASYVINPHVQLDIKG